MLHAAVSEYWDEAARKELRPSLTRRIRMTVDPAEVKTADPRALVYTHLKALPENVGAKDV